MTTKLLTTNLTERETELLRYLQLAQTAARIAGAIEKLDGDEGFMFDNAEIRFDAAENVWILSVGIVVNCGFDEPDDFDISQILITPSAAEAAARLFVEIVKSGIENAVYGEAELLAWEYAASRRQEDYFADIKSDSGSEMTAADYFASDIAFDAERERRFFSRR